MQDWAIDMELHVKLVMYGLLGITLCLTSAFATADVLVRLQRLVSAHDADSVTSNASHVRAIGLFALVAGVFYAFVFALADMSNAQRRRIELALQIEAYYSYPLTALLGACAALIYEVLRLREEWEQLRRAAHQAAAAATSSSSSDVFDGGDDMLERGALLRAEQAF